MKGCFLPSAVFSSWSFLVHLQFYKSLAGEMKHVSLRANVTNLKSRLWSGMSDFIFSSHWVMENATKLSTVVAYLLPLVAKLL